jgi:hypothetical protein
LAIDCSNLQGVGQEAFHIRFTRGQFTKDPVDAPNDVFVHVSQLKLMGGIVAGSFGSIGGNFRQGKAIIVTCLGLTRRNTDGMRKFFQFGRVEGSQIQIGNLSCGSCASFGSDNIFYLILDCHTLSNEFGNAFFGKVDIGEWQTWLAAFRHTRLGDRPRWHWHLERPGTRD